MIIYNGRVSKTEKFCRAGMKAIIVALSLGGVAAGVKQSPAACKRLGIEPFNQARYDSIYKSQDMQSAYNKAFVAGEKAIRDSVKAVRK